MFVAEHVTLCLVSQGIKSQTRYVDVPFHRTATAAHPRRWRRLDQALADKLGIVVRHAVHRPDGRPLAGKIRTASEGMLADAGLSEEFRPPHDAPRRRDVADAGRH